MSTEQDAPLPNEDSTAWRGKMTASHFLALGLLSMFAPLSIDMYLPALPSMTRSLHTSASVAQLSITACLIGISCGPLLMGPLSDRLGRRRPLLAGIIIYVFASLLCAVAPDIWVLIALRLVQGVSGSAGIAISGAIVRDMRSGNSAARLFSMLMLISGAAPAGAPVIGAQLLKLGSWRVVFVTLVIVGTLIGIITAIYLPETLPPASRRRGGVRATISGFRELFHDRTFVGYGLISGFIAGTMFAYIAGSPFVLENIFKLSPQEFSGVFAMNALGLVAFAQISAAIVNKFGSRRLVQSGVGTVVTASAVLFCVVLLHGPLGLILACLFLIVSNIGVVGANGMALAMMGHPTVAGSASALLSLMQFGVGAAIAPLVGVGGTHDAVPMATVIIVLAACGLAALVVVNARERSTRQIDLTVGSPSGRAGSL